jgi:hypothetical protein
MDGTADIRSSVILRDRAIIICSALNYQILKQLLKTWHLVVSSDNRCIQLRLRGSHRRRVNHVLQQSSVGSM